MLENRCVLCGRKHFDHFETIQDAHQEISYQICLHCGMISQWPRLSDEEVRWFNDHAYRGERCLDEIEEYEKVRAEVQFRLLYKEIALPKAMLDVGCSTGELLSRFKKHWSGLVTFGVEPNERLAEWAVRKGHRIVESTIALSSYSPFDLVTASHVLEHIPHPAEMLYNLKSRCNPGGRLFVEVPNLIEDLALEKAHLYAFTEDTLICLLEGTGWEPIWLKKHGAPKHPWLWAYLSVLAKPKDGFFISHETSPRGIKRARKLGKLKRLFAIATCGGENDVDSTHGVVVE